MNIGEDPRARSDAARVKVQRMQVKLHRWAGSDPGKKFDDLFNLVCDPDFLLVAWERVASNRGAQTPGIDRVTKEAINYWVGTEEFVDHIRGLLRAGTFRPRLVRRVEIPKGSGSGKIRQLGIPTLADRVVQASLKLVLEPIFEADFQPSSYGFRPNRRAQDAIAEIHHYASLGYPSELTKLALCGSVSSGAGFIIRVHWASSRPGSPRMLTVWTIWSGCAGRTGSSALAMRTLEVGGSRMAATSACSARHSRR